MDAAYDKFRLNTMLMLRVEADYMGMHGTNAAPLINGLIKNIKNNNRLDPRYQERLLKIFKNYLHKVLTTMVPDKSIDAAPNLEGKLGLLRDGINMIITDDPVAYSEHCDLLMPEEKMAAMIKDNASLFNDYYENTRNNGLKTISMTLLKDAFNNAFENSYKEAYGRLKQMLSPILKGDSHLMVEKILCFEGTVVYKGSEKSDLRHIRNLLEHPSGIRRDGYYSLDFDNGEHLDLNEDRLLIISAYTGLFSINMMFMSSVLMMLRLYELSVESGKYSS